MYDYKPWYKVWWMWLIIGIAVVIVLGAIGGIIGKHNASNSNSESNKVFKTTYNVGQTVDYKGLKIRVNKVYYWGGNDIDTPDSGKQYVMANVTLKNDSHKSKDPIEDDFTLDSNGSQDSWDEYLDKDDPHGGRDLGDGSLDPGASKTGLLYAQAKKGTKLQLKYQPNELNDNKKIAIRLN